MKEQEKQLLLKDLCARLPYEVKVQYAERIYDVVGCSFDNLIIMLPLMSNLEGHAIEFCKPYLRQMSSMTVKEQKEFVQFHCVTLCPVIINEMLTLDNESNMFDWLNEHHFDHRGLIEKGLALEAPEGMYNI